MRIVLGCALMACAAIAAAPEYDLYFLGGQSNPVRYGGLMIVTGVAVMLVR